MILLNEIAVIFKSSNGEPPADRDIRGHLLVPSRDKRFIKLDSQKPMCDPMTYFLLFPNGEDGWYVKMPYTNTTRRDRAEQGCRWKIFNCHVRQFKTWQLWHVRFFFNFFENYTDLFYQSCNRMVHYKNDSVTSDEE